jgi:hypothetical protein
MRFVLPGFYVSLYKSFLMIGFMVYEKCTSIQSYVDDGSHVGAQWGRACGDNSALTTAGFMHEHIRHVAYATVL